MTVSTTLRQLKESLPRHSYKRIVPVLGGEEKYGTEMPVPLTTVVKSLGPHEGLTMLSFAPDLAKATAVARQFAVSCIRHVSKPDDRKAVLAMLSTPHPREAIDFERRSLIRNDPKKNGAARRLGVLMATSILLDETQNIFARAQHIADTVAGCGNDTVSIEIEWQRQALIKLLQATEQPVGQDQKGALHAAMSTDD